MNGQQISRFWLCCGILFLLLTCPFLGLNGTSSEISKFTAMTTFKGHSSEVSSVAWSPDGSAIASGSWDDTVKVWDPFTGRALMTLEGHRNRVNCVAWSPDGSRIASGSWDETVKIWDAEKGTALRTLTGHEDAVFAIAWSPDGTRIASGSEDGTVKVWDPATGTDLETFPGDENRIYSVAWSPDGKEIASGSEDGTIRVWGADNGTLLKTMRGHSNGVDAVAWGPNGSTLASGSWDRTVKVWDAATSVEIRTYTGFKDIVDTVAWSPNGSMLAAGSRDRTFKVWDAATGADLLTVLAHDYAVSSVAWSPDGSMLASGSYDDTAMVWGIPWIDVHLTNVTVDRSNITAGQSTTIYAFLFNNGTADASSVTVGFYCGPTLLGTKLVDVPRNARTSTTYDWTTDRSTRPGRYTLYARVGDVLKNATVNVLGRPHVYITVLRADRTSIDIGGAVTITAAFANNGTAKAVNAAVRFYDDSTVLATRYMDVAINGTNMTGCVWQTTNATLDGPHDIWAVLFYPDLSWKNIKVVVIGKPSVYVLNVTADKRNVTVGDTFNVTAKIANNGTAGASGIEVRFYDGPVLVGSKNISIARGKIITTVLELNSSNMSIGNHTLRASMDKSMKETTVDVRPIVKKPRTKRPFADEWVIWLLLLVLLAMALTLMARGLGLGEISIGAHRVRMAKRKAKAKRSKRHG